MFGTIGSLIRLEHVILIAAMSLFAIEPLYVDLREVWKSIGTGFVKNWKVFVMFFGILALALFSLALRNWFFRRRIRINRISVDQFRVFRGFIRQNGWIVFGVDC